MSNLNKTQSGQRKTNYKSQKLKQIDALYREQIKKIYGQSKLKLDQPEEDKKSQIQEKKVNYLKKDASSNVLGSRMLMSPKSSVNLNVGESQVSSKLVNSGSTDDKVRASVFLKGQSTRTIQILRRENESKELKIRELSNKCQNLVQKLKKYLNETQFQQQMQTVRQFSDGKMQRLEHLFKIKQEQIFFKIKLQIIGLLQQFGIVKEELAQFNDISTESNLFTLMVRKLKNRLKDFRSKEQESSFQIQRDKILNQKQEQRIHYLTQTNELLKLSQSKLKSKVEDLKYQLSEYLQKMKGRQKQYEHNENQVYRLKKQHEELQQINYKLNINIKNINNDREDDKRLWQAKQKQMKILLNNYFIEKKKLQTDLQQKDGQVQQLIIKHKFLQQENQRINRQLVRWKQRYEWMDKQRLTKIKQLEDQKNQVLLNFQQYKLQYNQSVLISQKGQVDQALRKIQQYQRAYERVVLELEDQKNLLRRSQQQTRQRIEFQQKRWLEKFKTLQKLNQNHLYEINQDYEARIRDLRQQHTKKQQLLSEEMQARLKALLAQRDKNSTEQMILLQTENDQLRRQITDLNKIIEVKQSLINVINNKKV